MEQEMKFNVIFHLPNGDKWCAMGCCRDETWDSEFAFDQGLTKDEAVAKAAEYIAHPKFECSDGEIHIIPETPSPSSFALCTAIEEQAKVDAKKSIKRRSEVKVQEKAARKQRANDEQEARERAELERLQGKYGT